MYPRCHQIGPTIYQNWIKSCLWIVPKYCIYCVFGTWGGPGGGRQTNFFTTVFSVFVLGWFVRFLQIGYQNGCQKESGFFGVGVTKSCKIKKFTKNGERSQPWGQMVPNGSQMSSNHAESESEELPKLPQSHGWRFPCLLFSNSLGEWQCCQNSGLCHEFHLNSLIHGGTVAGTAPAHWIYIYIYIYYIYIYITATSRY